MMRVFVSATSNGLRRYREWSVEILRALGADPISQDEFPSSYRAVEQILKDAIAECDAMICLIGLTYGTEPLYQSSDTPRSFSQLEYFFARELQLPMYIFDGRECALDDSYREEAPEKRQLQARFWADIEAHDPRLRHVFRSHGDLDLRLIEICKEWEIKPPPRLDLMPTPLARLHSRAAKAEGGQLRVCLARLLAFTGCLGIVEAGKPPANYPVAWSFERLDDGIDLLRSLPGKIASPFVTNLWQDLPPLTEILPGHGVIAVDEEPPDEVERLTRDWRKSFLELTRHLSILTDYLLVQVEDAGDAPRLRIHRGLDPNQHIRVQWSQDRPQVLAPGAVFLLSLARRQAMGLSPVVQPAEENCAVLCGLSAKGGQALPLGLEIRPSPGRLEWQAESAWQGELLAVDSWNELSLQFPVADRSKAAQCGDWRVLGSPYFRGRFIDLFFVHRSSDREEPSAMLYWARSGLAENERQRVAERLRLWHLLSTDPEIHDLVSPVLDAGSTDEGGRPFLVTASTAGYRPLTETLDLTGNLDDARVAATMRAAMRLCNAAGRAGIRLLSFHPRRILVNASGEHRFVGFNASVLDNSVVTHDRDWRRLFRDANDLAPEMHQGALADATSDIFALGALLRRLQNREVLALPPGEQRWHRNENMWDAWRERPLECFAFHCLASDRNCRFQALDQCAEAFDRCIGAAVPTRSAEPEMVPLIDGLEIGRFPITNFQFERFCKNVKRPEPVRGLGWRYATPLAPVVWVRLDDALAYCDWLTRKSGGSSVWRLPREKEWLLAAGVAGEVAASSPFPWGEHAPSRTSANCAGEFGGPTAVGSYPQGAAPSGCLDLAGNVWEWCMDRLPAPPLRVLKGGSFASSRSQLRLTASEHRLFGGRFADVGFRVVREWR